MAQQLINILYESGGGSRKDSKSKIKYHKRKLLFFKIKKEKNGF